MTGNDIRIVFSRNLKLFRSRQGISQLTLATHLGMGPNFISDIECGKKWISPDTMAKLAEALNVAPDDFFITDQGTPKESEQLFQTYIDDVTRTMIKAAETVKERYRSSNHD